jgi:NADH:ubiquinone oxidoreductase subunit F (NADH-binding)/NADH:ubiquinone oxidoreductase subunit E
MIQKNKRNRRQPDPLITEIVERHQHSPESVLEILCEVQDLKHGLSAETITTIAQELKVPARHVYGVASFYTMLSLSEKKKKTIRVCDGPVCWLCGSTDLRQAIDRQYEDHPDWNIEKTSCLGLCDRAPAVLMDDQQIGPVSVDQVHLLSNGYLGKPSDYSTPRQGEVRVMLAKTGVIDPNSLESALEHGAYCGLGNALEKEPQKVLEEVETSGLTGRGGAGFPVGRKWRFVAEATNNPKYIICNADESEPLIFKDRILIDTNPHQILEGMAISGYACGANEAYIYIRGEYEHQAQLLERAIEQAERANWLGENIQGSGYSFHIHVHRGAGAYICGEETALIESLEGKRGEPRNRPPYPPTFGLHGLPTLVNNVESFAAVPQIICNGGDWYRSLSNYTVPGTKIYLVLGHVNNPGLFEAPFGLTLRQVIEDFGGGMRPGSNFHFALAGGAAGTIVSENVMDIPVDYSSGARGISLGAGAFLICDQNVSPVAFLGELLRFFAYESCGKCTPCRVGTQRAFDILTAITAGEKQEDAITELTDLADNLYDASFCGLGQSVAIPIRTALASFHDAFLALQ